MLLSVEVYYILKRVMLLKNMEVRGEKCSEKYQHKIKFVLTFTKNDHMLKS